MEMYKKKPLKFSHEKFSHDSRHAETLEVRESSRFKRLSLSRNFKDNGCLEDNVETKSQKNLKKPISRIEMLKKWKEEKLAKQELEKKTKKKPFIVGAISRKSSMAEAAPTSSNQPPRVPYNFKAAYLASKTVSDTMKCPSSMLQKPTTKGTVNAESANKFTSAARTVVTVNKIGMTRSIPISEMSKPAKMKENSSIKSSNQFISAARAVVTVNKIGMTRTNPVSGIPKPTKMKENSAIKSSNQESSLPKANFSRAPCKPVQKVCPGLPKLAKGIPVQPQSQMAASNTKMKPDIKAPNKPAVKCIPKPIKIVPSRNSVLFKKPISLKAQEPMGKTARAANFKDSLKNKNISKKPEAKLEAMKITKSSKEAVSEKSLKNNKAIENSSNQTVFNPSIEDIPDVALHCDASLIKPTASVPPRVQKCISRISSPSKDPSDRTSGFCVKKTEDSTGMNPSVTEEKKEEILCQKTPEKSGEKKNTNFEFSLSEDFLDMEKQDILGNDKSIDGIDDERDKNQNINEVVSYGLLQKKPHHKEMQNVSLGKKTHSEQICTDSCNNEICVNDIISEPLVLESENEEPLAKGISEEVAPTTALPNEGTAEPLISKTEPLVLEIENEEQLTKGNSEEIPSTTSLTNEGTAESATAKPLRSETDDISGKLEAVNLTERKSTDSGAKGMSMLKNVSVSNAVAELDESNIHPPSKSSKKHQNVCTPRRSLRLSSHKSEIPGVIKVLPATIDYRNIISSTPCHSSRLHKTILNVSENNIFSPFKEKKFGFLNTPPRRSMRVINLNTPEENESASYCKSNLTVDFGKLRLDGENMDPKDLSIQFEESPIVR